MTGSKYVVAGLMSLCVASSAHGADLAAGKTLAEAVCAACHGANGVSVSGRTPNLAGQRAAYLDSQLKAYKSKKRNHGIMSGLTSQLGNTAIADLAAYYASLPGAAVGAPNSKPPAHFIAKRIKLPSDLSGFTHYHTFNHKGRKQLRKIYANKVALEAAMAGKDLPDGSLIVVEAFKAKLGPDKEPVTGSDGLYIANGRAGFTAMERRTGWGDDFHPAIRNSNWHYGVYKPDRSPRPNVNQASCLSCHKPYAGASYLFTLKELQATARK